MPQEIFLENLLLMMHFKPGTGSPTLAFEHNTNPYSFCTAEGGPRCLTTSSLTSAAMLLTNVCFIYPDTCAIFGQGDNKLVQI